MNPIDDYGIDGEQFQDSTYYPKEDKKQKEDIQKQKAVIANSYPILEDVLQWFDEQIEDDSVDNIQTELIIGGVGYSDDVKVSIEAQVYAIKLLKSKLADKKKDFEERFEDGHGE